MLYSRHGGDADKNNYTTDETPVETRFDYLLPKLMDDASAHIQEPNATKVTQALKDLADGMAEDNPQGNPVSNSAIPAVYTYWGQFIDHDISANTDRNGDISDIRQMPVTPLKPHDVADKLPNLRRPTFDLDSLYGNGPGLDPAYPCPDPGPPDTWLYDGAKFWIGEVTPVNFGAPIPEATDLARDLPRAAQLIASSKVKAADVPDALRNGPNAATVAAIADARNDENLIVAQFHLAVLRFHNAVVDEVMEHPGEFDIKDDSPDTATVFATAQRLTRFHYQWLVVHDYLRTITLPGTVDEVLVEGPRFYPDKRLFAPLEYSVAAFRFGHSMIRGAYDHNRNFGLPGFPGLQPRPTPLATLDELFQFTGGGFLRNGQGGALGGAPTLPDNWIIEWDRMTSKVDTNGAHFARKIDTRLVPPLLDMVNQGNSETDLGIRALLRHLAHRNLLRGYQLAIPTGQAMAQAMGVVPLTKSELETGNSPKVTAALKKCGFIKNTPLWFYLLKEAEVRANGNCLGELGSLIVVETQLGLMHNDENSHLRAGWDPSRGVKLKGRPIVTIRDFFKFAGLIG